MDEALPAVAHAFGDDALGEYDAVGLAEELRAGRVSRREVVEAAIERAERLQPVLDAVACPAYDQAREAARRPAMTAGFFAGVPTFVKDNSDVAGLPTQQGTTSYVAKPAIIDGDWARGYFRHGLVNLGKTRLSEFGFSASAEYVDAEPVRNPWHLGHTPGASSAGSAALVAAGVVPIAHANDGGGSIRIPAACSGLVGLKPTRGRTPSDKVNREMPVRIVADGVLTRSVRDSAAFLRESEKVYRDLRLRPVGDVRGPGRKRLRVALTLDSIGGRSTEAETREATRKTAGLLESLGHHVEEVEAPVPESFEGDFLLYWSMLAAVLTSTGKLTVDRSFEWRRTDNLTRGLARNCARNSWQLPRAIARLRASSRLTARLLTSYDVSLSPTLAHLSPELGHLNPSLPYELLIERLLDWVRFTPLQNATGDPAISLPMGMSATGLPIGVQLSAGHGREGRLLALAYELEQAQPFVRIQDR